MKTITKFQAYNGTEFIDQTACLVYEVNCRRADDIISILPPKPNLPGCGFENGDGYLQHDREVFLKVRRLLLEQALVEFPDDKHLEQSLAEDDVHPSWAARIIGECCTKQLDRAWYRIYCTDKEFREWGQPYYALNPTEGKQVCLNETAPA
jgi:hypothetical protein